MSGAVVEVARMRVCFALALLLLMPLAGCSGDDGPGGKNAEEAVEAVKAGGAEKGIAGSFVGEVPGAKAFVAVVAAPEVGKKGARAVEVYVSDGRRLSEWFSGSISGNSFVAKSEADDTSAKGKLSSDSVRGTVQLPGGRSVRYQARAPSGAAGLYDLTVSADGDLRGASAAGLGITGEIKLRERGTGMLKLVDGKRLEFEVARSQAGDVTRLRAGQVRLIVLPGGQLRGAGKGRPGAGGGKSHFFIRSA